MTDNTKNLSEVELADNTITTEPMSIMDMTPEQRTKVLTDMTNKLTNGENIPGVYGGLGNDVNELQDKIKFLEERRKSIERKEQQQAINRTRIRDNNRKKSKASKQARKKNRK